MTGRAMADDRISYATVTTPDRTFVKHTFVLTDGHAKIERAGKVHAELHDATVTFGPGSDRRVEGTNAEGETVVWRAVNLGCGCHHIAQIVPTDPAQIPT